MSGRRSSRKNRKNPPVSEQPQQPPQAEEEAQKVEEEGPSPAELTVPPPPKDDRGKGRGKKGKARDKRKRRDSHEDGDAEGVQSEEAQEEADSEDEAESEVPVTEKKRRKAKAPAVNLTPEQEEDISEWLKLNPWLWDKNPPSTSQFVSTSTSSTSCEQMPDWPRKYQRADQDFLIPEGQTTFTPAQLSYLPEPNQVTRIVRVQHVPHAQQQQQLVVPGQLPQKTFAHLRPVRVPTATATVTTGAAALSFSPAVRHELSQSAPCMQSSMDLGSNTPVFLGTPEASLLPDPSPQSTGLGDSFRSLLKDLE